MINISRKTLTKMMLLTPIVSKTYSTLNMSSAPNYFNYSIYSQPHPDKISKGGEDANFGSPNILSVADGVGGWSEIGVDPAIYSKKLIEK